MTNVYPDDHRKSLWTVEDILRIAAEECIDIGGSEFSMSGLLAHPDGFSRADVARSLRHLVAIPADAGER